MKVWIEYPDTTRFARYHSDIEFTPIFFANEGISGYLCFESEEPLRGSISELDASVTLTGAVDLGFFKLGIGFKAIYRIKILTYTQNLALSLTRTPFTFSLPASSLEEIQQLASSLKIISSDTATTIDILNQAAPAMMITVKYTLQGKIGSYEPSTPTSDSPSSSPSSTSSPEQEIRLYTCFDEAQLPSLPPSIELTSSQTITLPSSKLPLFQSKKKKIQSQFQPSLTFTTAPPLPLTFQPHSDAAATKLTLTLHYTYNTNNTTIPTTPPPPHLQSTLEWLLISTTTLHASRRIRNSSTRSRDTFTLRSKLLPTRKLRLSWQNWTRTPSHSPTSPLPTPSWQASQDIWLTSSLAEGLAPTFATAYVTHGYVLSVKLTLAAGMGRAAAKAELLLPMAVRYDLGLAPCYTVDAALPEYEFEMAAVVGPGEATLESERGAAAAVL